MSLFKLSILYVVLKLILTTNVMFDIIYINDAIDIDFSYLCHFCSLLKIFDSFKPDIDY